MDIPINQLPNEPWFWPIVLIVAFFLYQRWQNNPRRVAQQQGQIYERERQTDQHNLVTQDLVDAVEINTKELIKVKKSLSEVKHVDTEQIQTTVDNAKELLKTLKELGKDL